jgi:hypothetical protein
MVTAYGVVGRAGSTSLDYLGYQGGGDSGS